MSKHRLLSWMLLFLIGCTSAPHPSHLSKAPPGEAWLTPEQMEQAQLQIQTIQAHGLNRQVITSGRVTFDDLRVTHVFSPVTGRVIHILAQTGQRVKKGQPLLSIDSPDVGIASSDRDKAWADFKAAQRDYMRQKTLYKAHAGAQRDFETAEDSYLKAKAEFERAQQKTRLLKTGGTGGTGASAKARPSVSQHYMLRAPMAGEIIARHVNPGTEIQGQYTGASSPVELFTLGDLNSVWVLADVFEMDLAQVEKGQTVEVSVVTYPHETFKGRLDWVSPALDPSTRTAKVRCRILNPDHKLKPEMFATVVIVGADQSQLALPRQGLVRLGDTTVVFIQSGQGPQGQIRFERRPVTVDEDTVGDWLPVVRGVAAGEKVVTSGALLLLDMT